MRVNIACIDKVEYEDSLKIQERLNQLRQADKIEDTLLIVEHDPVLTLGVAANVENVLLTQDELKEKNIKIYETNRGGDVTYHGPGQIVGYPIIHLNNKKLPKEKRGNLHGFVLSIEELFIRLLEKEYNIKAERGEKRYTGVWVDNDKITAIGIAVRRWVSMHGFAFNVNTNLEHFSWITPCGIQERGVTSLQKILGYSLDMIKVKKQVSNYFCEIFNYQPNEITSGELNELLEMKNES